jgi:hypothetical protein
MNTNKNEMKLKKKSDKPVSLALSISLLFWKKLWMPRHLDDV